MPEINGDPIPSEEPTPLHVASLSLSVSTILPSHFFLQPKTPSFNNKLPSQASSLTHLSFSTTTTSPSHSKTSFKSTISANPLYLGPHRPSDPFHDAAVRRASIVWFRNDLLVHDNDCLNAANNDSVSILPVYSFDPADYGKSSSGFDKTGPYRTVFSIQSVSNLRKNLQARGRISWFESGGLRRCWLSWRKLLGLTVFILTEVSRDEVKAEERVEAAMKEVMYFWRRCVKRLRDAEERLVEVHGCVLQ